MNTQNDTPASLGARLLALFNTSTALLDASPTRPYEDIITSTLNDMETVFTEWEQAHDLGFITAIIRQGPQHVEEDSRYNYVRDYRAPPSVTPSDATEHDVPDALLCTICSRRQISVQFVDCVHAACKDCAKGLWRAKIEREGHFPDHFSCPCCREYIYELRRLDRMGNESEGEDVEVPTWILEVSRSAAEIHDPRSELDVTEYRAPPSVTPSDATEHDVPDALLCTICGRRQISVKFRDCVHAACKDCVKGMWRARIQHEGHLPGYINCPLCRDYVYELRKLDRRGNESDATDVAVMAWILEVSRSAADM